MSYAQPHTPSGRRLTALVAVGILPVLLLYDLIHGLARKLVEVVRAPRHTTSIGDVKRLPEASVPGCLDTRQRNRPGDVDFPDRRRRQGAGKQGRALFRPPPPR